MNNRFVMIVVGLVIGFGALFWFTKKEATAPGSNTNNTTVQATNHTQGAGNKGVTLVEYGDLQCPACGSYFPILKQVKAKFGDDLKFQFRHFPLVQLHPNAMAAHRAAEAAGMQGKFFEMHDMLYEQQLSWTNSQNVSRIFEDYAAQLALNIEKFKTDAASQQVNDIINADIKEGQNLKANSTPTFILNGKKIEQNPRDAESFIKLIEDAIKEQSQQ